MFLKSKSPKKSQLEKSQDKLLKVSLRNLLGDGLLKGEEKKRSHVKAMVLKDALNAIVLNN